jgi:hypothetical protein
MKNPFVALAESIARYPRRTGATMSAAAFAIVYWQLILPFQEADRGAREITASMKFGGMSVALLLISISFTIFGWKAVRFFNPQPGEPKALPYLAAIVIAAVAFGTAVAVQNALEASGYTFSF